MFGPKFWLPFGLAAATLILTMLAAFHASVSWSALLLRSIVSSLVMGGIGFALVSYIDRILIGKHLSDPGTDGAVRDNVKGNQLDVQVPPVLPFVPGQIEQDLERLLTADPVRAAEIIRKMQLNE